MGRSLHRLTTAVLTAVVLTAACTPPERPPTGLTPTGSPGAGGTSTAEEETPTPATSPSTRPRGPSVVVVHASRPAPRISAAVARRITNGTVRTWRPLDGSRRPLRIVPTVRAVTRDRDAVAVVPVARLRPTVRPAVVDGVDPLLTGPRGVDVTRIAVTGDIMLGRRVGTSAPTPGRLAALFEPMSRELRSADLTLGNLESALSTAGPPQQGGDSFAAGPAAVRVLGEAGFDAVSLANNHTGDYGLRALLDTVAAFREGPVAAFGAGADLARASRPYVATLHGGATVGVVGFNAIGESPRASADAPGVLSMRMPPRTGPLNRGDLAHVTRVVRRLDRQVDVVVVLPHWGTQYTHVAEPVQRTVSRHLVEAGADLVVGGHPHWVQGLDWEDGAVVAHSLGNFVFDMDFMTKTQQGVLLEAVLWDGRLRGVSLVPYEIGADFAPRPARGATAARILGDVWRHSTGPFSAS